MVKEPKRKKRPSRAAVARLREEVESRPKNEELPAEVVAVIEAYVPARVSVTTMEKVRPLSLIHI